MQHDDLEKTKVLKTQRDSRSDVRKPNAMSVLKSVLSVRPVLHIGQTSWTYPWASSVLLLGSRDVYRTCPVLDQTSPVNNMIVRIWAPSDKSGLHRTCPGPKSNLPIQWVSFRECTEPVWGHLTSLTGMVDRSDRYALTALTTSFLDSYKRNSIPSLVGC
jgi:hypothetical protein